MNALIQLGESQKKLPGRRDVSHWNLHLGEWLGLWLGSDCPFHSPCSAPGVLAASPTSFGFWDSPCYSDSFLLEAVPQISYRGTPSPVLSPQTQRALVTRGFLAAGCRVTSP